LLRAREGAGLSETRGMWCTSILEGMALFGSASGRAQLCVPRNLIGGILSGWCTSRLGFQVRERANARGLLLTREKVTQMRISSDPTPTTMRTATITVTPATQSKGVPFQGESCRSPGRGPVRAILRRKSTTKPVIGDHRV
jgi:hypothetical protein